MPVVFYGVWPRDTSLSERGIIATKDPSSTLNALIYDYFEKPLWRWLLLQSWPQKSRYLPGKSDFFPVDHKLLSRTAKRVMAVKSGLVAELRRIQVTLTRANLRFPTW